MPDDLESRLSLQKRVIAVHDLAGYTRATRSTEAFALAAFIDEYYTVCGEAVVAGGGRIVKFMGDAMLAVFPPEKCVEAIEAIERIQARVGEVAARRRLMVGSGNANVHLATVVEGDLGPPGDRRFDILGEGVNHTFLLGARQGHGIHISEPVYRQLPNERRGPWKKYRPSAVYTLPC